MTEAEMIAPERLDEEDIRLTTGFADIFTAMLLLLGAVALGGILGPGAVLAAPVAAWFLATPLVETRRFAACGTMLALIVAAVPAVLLGDMMGPGGLLVSAALSAVFWRRFRIPAALALAWIAATGFVMWLGFGDRLLGSAAAAIIAGLILFALALRHDASDRLRQTLRSDVAFWLHLAAAPLIVHGLFSLIHANPWLGEVPQPWLVIALFAGLTLVSLVIDRRPVLVSSFAYLIAATASLLTGAIEPEDYAARAASFADAALAPGVVGAVMLALAAGWTPLRRALLALLPAGLANHLPPPAVRAVPADDRPDDLPVAEKEPVRLVLGFNDLFVALGALAMVIGAAVAGGRLAYEMLRTSGLTDEQMLLTSAAPWLAIALPAIVTWAIAEYFVRVRRMAWPAIALAFAFSWCCLLAGLLVAFRIVGSHPLALAPGRPELPTELVLSAFGAFCALGLAGNLGFWWRHRVPVSFALAIAALVPLVFVDRVARIARDIDTAFTGADWAPRLLAAGVAVFAGAIAWDRADPERRTQRADVAFWLHLLASLLAIPALIALLLRLDGGAFLVFAAFAAIVALALVIDRRAPIAVSLPFVLVQSSGLVSEQGNFWVSLVLAAGLLALVLRWDQVRAKLVLKATAPG